MKSTVNSSSLDDVTVGRRTYDREVVDSTPGRVAIKRYIWRGNCVQRGKPGI